jgi:LuxR family maltose regulon positive regulatory protein
VTPDPDDGDPLRFWAHVLTALRQSGAPESVLETLPAHLPSADGAFQHLLEDGFGRLPEPVVLVLDDFHTISTPRVLDAVQTMLRHSAPRLRLVISTRVDPNLPQLPRLRLNGELVELRTADMAFTTDEAAELLDGHGVALSATDLALLKARTEGWAAGLRLAALWLQDRPDPTWAVAAFAGTDRTVADYLVAEIMDQQSPDMRDFLLSTCVVDQISGSLANALTGGTDGDQALVSLERANAFIAAVGPNRLWYRYHPLFAELLRFELRRRAPEELVRLHQRAAHWHGEHGSPVDAVRHALDAQDWAYSVDLLTQHGLGWVLQGRTRTIRQAAERLPPEVVRDAPELSLLVAFERLESLDHEAVRRYLKLAHRQQVLVPEHRADRFTLLRSLLELIAARRSGEFERVMVLGRGGSGVEVLTVALDRQDHVVARRCHHAGEHHGPDDLGARRDDDLGDPDAPVDERVAVVRVACGRDEVMSRRERLDDLRLPPCDEDVAGLDRGVAGPQAARSVEREDGETRIGGVTQVRHPRTDQGRARADVEP